MRDESGWSIVELLLVCVLLIVIMGGTLNLLDTTAKIAPQEQERVHALREAQVGLARMTRELRQATKVLASNDTMLQVHVPVNGVRQTVTYECAAAAETLPAPAKACRRTQVGGVANEVVIDRVTNTTAVFTRTGEDYVRVRIEVPASGERKQGLRHTIVLDDGFFMRNLAD